MQTVLQLRVCVIRCAQVRNDVVGCAGGSPIEDRVAASCRLLSPYLLACSVPSCKHKSGGHGAFGPREVDYRRVIVV